MPDHHTSSAVSVWPVAVSTAAVTLNSRVSVSVRIVMRPIDCVLAADLVVDARSTTIRPSLIASAIGDVCPVVRSTYRPRCGSTIPSSIAYTYQTTHAVACKGTIRSKEGTAFQEFDHNSLRSLLVTFQVYTMIKIQYYQLLFKHALKNKIVILVSLYQSEGCPKFGDVHPDVLFIPGYAP